MEKNKVITIFVIVIAVILIVLVGLWIYLSSIGFIVLNPENLPTKEQKTKLEQSLIYAKGVVGSRTLENEKVETEYYVILNKEGKVTETFVVENVAGYDKQQALKKAQDSNTFIYLPRIEGDKIVYKHSLWNGKTKDNIIEFINVMENPVYTII